MTFLKTKADRTWLMQTHLKGVPLPPAYEGWRYAVLHGNEDAPHSIDLYLEDRYLAPHLHIEFNADAPIYCEMEEITC